MGGCYPWYLLTPEERKKRNAASTAKNRKYHLPAIAPIGAAASRAWYFAQPPEVRALIVSRLVAAGLRAQAIKKGHAPPIIFEHDRLDLCETGFTITVDQAALQKHYAANPPDPTLYRPLPGGGYSYIPTEENQPQATISLAEAKRIRRQERRRQRRAERRVREGDDAVDITPRGPKPPDPGDGA
jgi:hypothetical protein